MSDPEDHAKEETVTAPPAEEVKEADTEPKAIPKEELGVRPGHVPGSEQPSAA